MKAKSLLLSLALGGALTASAAPECELLSATPAPGTALEFPGLPLGRDYSFNTNINVQVGYVEAVLHDVTGDPEEPEYICETYASHTVGSNTPIEITSYDAYSPLLTGHDYQWTVTCYDQEIPYLRTEVGSFKVLYKGASASYEYSDIQAIAISPNPETYIIEAVNEAHFTVSFSGPVEINKEKSNISRGMMGVVPYASITPNADKTDWTFVIPETELEERVANCFILAQDSEGRTVRGNEDMAEYESGDGDGAGFMFTYTSQLAGTAVTVTPAAGPVTELKTFVVANNAGYTVANPSWTDYPYFMKDKEFIYKWNLETDAKFGAGKVTLTLPDDKVPTVSGRYQLILPYACVMFQITADDQGGYANAYTVLSYNLNLGTAPEVVYDIVPASISPAPGNVNEIKTFDIHFANDTELVNYNAYILDSTGATVAKADINFDDDMTNYTDYHVTFNPAITTPGTYTLYIPEGTFGDTSYAENGRGHTNADIRETYVLGVTGVEGLAADAAVGNVYSVTGICVLRDAKAADLNALPKGVYILNGKKIVVR